MASWRWLLVLGQLSTSSALVAPSWQGSARAGAAASPHAWAKSDVAVLLPLAQCSHEGFWQDLSDCLGNVASGAREAGKTVSVHVAATQDCSASFATSPPSSGDNVQVSVNTTQAISSAELLSGLLEGAKAAGVEHDLVLVAGVDAAQGDALRHRAMQSLCGSAPQVVSVLRQFRSNEMMQLLAPLGTMMTQSTKTADILPALRRARFGQDETCERIVSPNLLARLGRSVSSKATPVAVAGGMYWARHSALPGDTHAFSGARSAALGAGSADGRDAQRAVLEVWIPSQVHAAGGVLAEIPPAPKPLAIYLPQFHPIPENDYFWGDGFTEWTLLKPYRGEQIVKPLSVEEGGLGYYDLRDRDVRKRQADLARDHGIHGFVFYHYWFKDVRGGKVMYKVPELRLADGEPDMPFMLSWANEPWSKHWDGGRDAAPNTLMIPQDYGSEADWVEHFNYLLQFFKHPKYIRVEGKPAFSIYRAGHMGAKLAPMLTVWQRLARESGLPGLHIIATVTGFYKQPEELAWQGTPALDAAFHYLASNRCCWKGPTPGSKNIASTSFDQDEVLQRVQYWGAYAGFDNRPRGKPLDVEKEVMPFKLSPGDFGAAVALSLEGMAQHPQRDISDNLFFLASWNEWNEQSVLEPSDTHKFGFLEALSDQLRKMPTRVFAPA